MMRENMYAAYQATGNGKFVGLVISMYNKKQQLNKKVRTRQVMDPARERKVL